MGMGDMNAIVGDEPHECSEEVIGDFGVPGEEENGDCYWW